MINHKSLRILCVLALLAQAAACDGTVAESASDGEAVGGSAGIVPESPSASSDPGAAAGGNSTDPSGAGDAGAAGGANGEYPCGQWFLPPAQVPNARDLGGIVSANGSTIGCGVLYRGSALTRASDQGCTAFADRGIRTVVDVRMPTEVQAAPNPECVVSQAHMVSAPLPIPYSVSPADYLADLESVDSIRTVFAVLGDPAAYPVYLHCVYGRDRTGVLVAEILLALGVPRDVIVADYERTREAGFSTSPASLAAVLDAIEARGGIEAHLAYQGIPLEALTVLRDKAFHGLAL